LNNSSRPSPDAVLVAAENVTQSVLVVRIGKKTPTEGSMSRNGNSQTVLILASFSSDCRLSPRVVV